MLYIERNTYFITPYLPYIKKSASHATRDIETPYKVVDHFQYAIW